MAKIPKKLKPKKPRKHVPTEAELANDPSIKWCGYRTYELVWSDAHGREMRFVEYLPSGKVRLAELDSMGLVAGEYEPTSVRRPTAGHKGRDYYDVSRPAE